MILASGLPMKRPRDASGNVQCPCHRCPKIPVECANKAPTSADAIEPSEQSWKVIWHYRECKATGDFPKDDIVRRNAAIIYNVDRQIDDSRQEQLIEFLRLLRRA